MPKRVNYPKWVEKYRNKGTNISHINGNYYLYAVSSKWSKEKGRAQKKTDAYIGKITEKGLIAKKVKLAKEEPTATVKEYGATSVIMGISEDLLQKRRYSFYG